VVQLHGGEPPAVAMAIRDRGIRVWKAVRLRPAADPAALAAPYLGAVDGVLLEGWSGRGHGGVGAAFDWQAAASARSALDGVSVIVAGGLDADGVARAIALLRPDVVDVSSGVEDAPCRKSAGMMNRFVAAAHAAGAAGVGSR
jgi:phosphoribosylanthranilate isomerase